MQTTLALRSFFVVLALLDWCGFTSFPAYAQDETYQAISGIDRVTELVNRLETQRPDIPKEIRQALLIEGRAILEEDRQAIAGKLPIQRELRDAIANTRRLDGERSALVSNPNRTQQQVDDFNRRQAAHKRYVENDLNPRADATNQAFERRIAKYRMRATEQLEARRGASQSYENLARAYQDKRTFAQTLFAKKEHFPARCAVVLSAALDLRPDPNRKEMSLANIDVNQIEPAFRGAGVLDRYYVQAQQLADRLARDWHQMERYNDWQTARAKVGGHKGVIFFRDADFRESTMSFTGDHIDVWDGAGTGSGYSFRSAKEIWFWELPK